MSDLFEKFKNRLFITVFSFPAYFSCVVKVLYNLLYYQVVAQLSCSMSSAERAQVLARVSESCDVRTLSDALSLVVETLGRSELYIEDDGASCDQQIKLNMNALEQQVSYFSIVVFVCEERSTEEDPNFLVNK